MSDGLRDALEKLADEVDSDDTALVNRRVTTKIRALLAAHPVEPAALGHSWSNGVHYPPTGGAHVVERCDSGCPAEPAGVSDEAVEVAEKAWRRAYHAKPFSGTDRSWMRVALEAARPLMLPEVVVDHRPGETCSVVAEVDPETGFARRVGVSDEAVERRAKSMYARSHADVDWADVRDYYLGLARDMLHEDAGEAAQRVQPQVVASRERVTQVLREHKVGWHLPGTPREVTGYQAVVTDALLAAGVFRSLDSEAIYHAIEQAAERTDLAKFMEEDDTQAFADAVLNLLGGAKPDNGG